MLKVSWEHPQKNLYDENGFIKLYQEIAEVFLIHRKCMEETGKGPHFYFSLLYCFDHVSIIISQVEKASALSRRWELSKCIISTDGEHIISCINLEQSAECPVHPIQAKWAYQAWVNVWKRLGADWGDVKQEAEISHGLPENQGAVVLPSEITWLVWGCIFWSHRRELGPHFFSRIKCGRFEIKSRGLGSLSSYSMPVAIAAREEIKIVMTTVNIKRM